MRSLRPHAPIAAAYAVAIGFAVLFLLPLVWILVTALKPSAEIYTADVHFLPRQPTLANFIDVAHSLPQFPSYMWNSIVVRVASVIGVVVVSALAAFPLARTCASEAERSCSPSSC